MAEEGQWWATNGCSEAAWRTLCAAEAFLVISAIAVCGRGLASPGGCLPVRVRPPHLWNPPLLPSPH